MLLRSLALVLCATPAVAACPYLDAAAAARALGGRGDVVVLDADQQLGEAASCRWQIEVAGVARELVVAERAVGTASGDPFAALRAVELAPLPVGETPFSVLVESKALATTAAWYAGCSQVGGVTLLWADEDGFQTAVVLDVPGLTPAQVFDRLRALATQLAGSL